MGTNICIVWRGVEDEMFPAHPDHRLAAFDYYWAAQRSDTDLLDFFTRTSFGHFPLIRIWSHPGREIPNLLSRLTTLLANRMVPPDDTCPWPTSCHWLHRFQVFPRRWFILPQSMVIWRALSGVILANLRLSRMFRGRITGIVVCSKSFP